jgi:hypothetical protein
MAYLRLHANWSGITGDGTLRRKARTLAMNLGCAAVDVRRALTATELCAARENREVPVEDLSKMAVGARQMQEKFPRRN